MNEEHFQVKPLPKSKKYKMIIIAALLLAGFVLAQIGQIIAANMNPKAYLGKVLLNTVKVYQEELRILQKNNPVIKKYDEILAGVSEHQLTMDSSLILDSMGYGFLPNFSLDLFMRNDPVKKQFQFGTDLPLVGGAYLYLSDQELIFSFLGENYALDAKNAGVGIRAFLDNNGIDYNESNLPEDLNLSYSALARAIKNGDAHELTPGYAALWGRYAGEWKKLYDAARIISANGTAELGGEEVKCRVMVLTFKDEAIRNWLSGLYELAENDRLLREIIGEGYDWILDDLKSAKDSESGEIGDIRASFFIYKDSVIQTYIEGDNHRIGLAANGVPYRLDHIEVEIFSPETDWEETIVAQGNHIGKGVFTSEITTSNENIKISWDSEQDSDNVIVSNGGTDTVFTLALDEEGVVFKPFTGSSRESLVCVAKPSVSGSISWPVRSTPFVDLNLQELFSKLNLFG